MSRKFPPQAWELLGHAPARRPSVKSSPLQARADPACSLRKPRCQRLLTCGGRGGGQDGWQNQAHWLMSEPLLRN